MAAVRPVERLHATLPIPLAHAPDENAAMSGMIGRAKYGCIFQPLLPVPTIAPCTARQVAMTTVA